MSVHCNALRMAYSSLPRHRVMFTDLYGTFVLAKCFELEAAKGLARAYGTSARVESYEGATWQSVA